jgi:hypothetical protein
LFLCMDCALICQSSGYNLKAKRKEKRDEQHEETKTEEKVRGSIIA